MTVDNALEDFYKRRLPNKSFARLSVANREVRRGLQEKEVPGLMIRNHVEEEGLFIDEHPDFDSDNPDVHYPDIYCP